LRKGRQNFSSTVTKFKHFQGLFGKDSRTLSLFKDSSGLKNLRNNRVLSRTSGNPVCRLWLPLLSAMAALTIPTTEHHRALTNNKLYCLVTEASHVNLSRVITWKRNSQVSNPRPLDHKIRCPHHYTTLPNICKWYVKLHSRNVVHMSGSLNQLKDMLFMHQATFQASAN